MSKKRWKPNQKAVKKKFSRTASKTHKKNIAPAPMRGGIRL